MTDPLPDRFMTTDQVAELLQVDPKTVRALVSGGHLVAVRLGKRLMRFDPRDVAACIEAAREKQQPATPPPGRATAYRPNGIVPWSERTDLQRPPRRGRRQ